MTDNLSISVHAFASCMLMSVSIGETLLPRKVNLSTSFRELQFSVEIYSTNTLGKGMNPIILSPAMGK